MAKKVKRENAYFVERLCAFIIDIFIISFVSSLFMIPFTDGNDTSNYSKKIIEVQEKFVDKEISMNQYFAETSSYFYKMARENGLLSLISLLLSVCYFVVLQTKMMGQTIGKKLMKIKVVSDKGDLFMNQMVLRGLLANFILTDIITFMFMLFLPKQYYLYAVLGIETLQYLYVVVCAFFILFRKDGRSIHDLLVHTRVVHV